MFGLPKDTQFNKNIPKQKFYEDYSATLALKWAFSEQIHEIIWQNRITPDTSGLAAGDTVKELEVFEIQLNQQKFDQAILYQIDQEVFEHILFLLEYQGKYQAWIGKRKKGVDPKRANPYVHTRGMDPKIIPLCLDGRNLDEAYENFVRQITGDAHRVQNVGSLKKAIMHGEQKRLLRREIAALEEEIRQEKQLGNLVELNCRLKKLKKELEEKEA